MMYRFRFVVACAALTILVSFSDNAQAGITSMSGAIEVIDPPFSVQLGVTRSNQRVRIFRERHRTTLSQAVEMDISSSGRFDESADRTPKTIARGTTVNSYFVHVDTPINREFTGNLVFGESILGLIQTEARLQSSHPHLRAPNTTYPANGSTDADWGELDLRSSWATLTLNMFENSLSLSVNARGARTNYGHLRIITQAQMPDYNGNGQVEQADLDLVLLNWGTNAIPAPSGWVQDLPYDTIDQDELDGVLLNWGTAVPQSLGASSAVPEPSSVLLAAACGLLAACTRWRLQGLRLSERHRSILRPGSSLLSSGATGTQHFSLR